MIVSSPREKLWAWVNGWLLVPWSEDFQAIGLVVNDCLCAVVAYNGFANNGCTIHCVVLPGTSLTRSFLRAVFSYPFKQCGLKYVMSTVAEENSRAVSLNLKAGMREVHRIPEASNAGKSILLLTMSAKECKWIGA